MSLWPLPGPDSDGDIACGREKTKEIHKLGKFGIKPSTKSVEKAGQEHGKSIPSSERL